MSTLTVNIDEQLKSKAQAKSKKDGMNLTALIAQLLKMYVQEDCEICLELRRQDKKLKHDILESSKELEKDIANGTAKEYTNVDELMKDLF